MLVYTVIYFRSRSNTIPETLIPLECGICNTRNLLISDETSEYLLFRADGRSSMCTVKSGSCPNCSNAVYVDGNECGVLNMGNFFIEHNVLIDCMRAFLLSGYVHVPMAAISIRCHLILGLSKEFHSLVGVLIIKYRLFCFLWPISQQICFLMSYLLTIELEFSSIHINFVYHLQYVNFIGEI